MNELEAIVLESVSSSLQIDIKDIIDIFNRIKNISGYSNAELYVIIALAIESSILNNKAIANGLLYILTQSMDECVVTEFSKWGVNQSLRGIKLFMEMCELIIITKEEKEINSRYKKLLAGDKYTSILNSLIRSCEGGKLNVILKCLKQHKKRKY